MRDKRLSFGWAWGLERRLFFPSGQIIPEDGRVAKEEEEEKEEEEDGRSEEGFMGMTPLLQAHHAMEKMEEFVHKVGARRETRAGPEGFGPPAFCHVLRRRKRGRSVV